MAVVDQNKQTGAERQTCRHYETFSQLYGAKASTCPKFTLDSTDMTPHAVEAQEDAAQNVAPVPSTLNASGANTHTVPTTPVSEKNNPPKKG